MEVLNWNCAFIGFPVAAGWPNVPAGSWISCK
jgi:hypothetical protein